MGDPAARSPAPPFPAQAAARLARLLQWVPSWGHFLGVLPAASGLLTPPPALATQGRFWWPTGLKLLEILGLPGALFCCFSPAAVAISTAPAAPPSPTLIQREGLIKRGVVGAIVLELDLACSGMLLGGKMKLQWYFSGSLQNLVVEKWVSTSSHLPLPEL